MLRKLVFLLFLGVTIQSAHSQTNVQQMVGQLLPIAIEARQGFLSNPTKSSYELQQEIVDAIKQASALPGTSENFSKIHEIFARMEASIGPLKTAPSFRLHDALKNLARLERNDEAAQYHDAYALALMVALSKTGNGYSPETALKVITIDEEYNWLGINQLKGIERKNNNIGTRNFDIWRVQKLSGEESTLYFDVTEIKEQFTRLLNRKDSSAPK
jgi:hypothetical protein